MTNKKLKTYTSTWTLQENPLYMTTCPHCKKTIIMSREPLIERLKKWATMFNKIVK